MEGRVGEGAPVDGVVTNNSPLQHTRSSFWMIGRVLDVAPGRPRCKPVASRASSLKRLSALASWALASWLYALIRNSFRLYSLLEYSVDCTNGLY